MKEFGQVGFTAQASATSSGRSTDHQDDQRPFWLQHPARPACVHALGVEQAVGALVVWLDPATGRCRFGGFLSAEDAAAQLQRQLGPGTPLHLVWDERPVDDDLPRVEEEVLLTKARVS